MSAPIVASVAPPRRASRGPRSDGRCSARRRAVLCLTDLVTAYPGNPGPGGPGGGGGPLRSGADRRAGADDRRCQPDQPDRPGLELPTGSRGAIASNFTAPSGRVYWDHAGSPARGWAARPVPPGGRRRRADHSLGGVSAGACRARATGRTAGVARRPGCLALAGERRGARPRQPAPRPLAAASCAGPGGQDSPGKRG